MYIIYYVAIAIRIYVVHEQIKATVAIFIMVLLMVANS